MEYFSKEDCIRTIQYLRESNDELQRFATNQDQTNSILTTCSHLMYVEKFLNNLPVYVFEDKR